MKQATKYLLLFILLCLIGYRWRTSVTIQESTSKKAIIIGASSGIGKALAQVLSEHGYTVGLAARRVELLQELKLQLPNDSIVQKLDLMQPEVAMQQVEQLIDKLGGLDLMVINAGVGHTDEELDWEKQKKMINVNVVGFAAMANVALKHFVQQKHGHLVGISSISALRGATDAFTYCATKAFDSRLLEGIRATMKAKKLPIYVTDIQPGFVDTEMVKDVPDKMWVATPNKAAQQIYNAIKNKKEHAYVSKRWRLAAWLLRWAPDWLIVKVF